jgi:PAS domain S-box-containing protein
MKPDRKAILIFLAVVVVIVVLAVVQGYSDIIHGTVYYLMVGFYGLYLLRNYRYLWSIGVAVTGGIVAGYVLGSEESIGAMVNRVFSVITFWGCILIAIRFRLVVWEEKKYKNQLNALFENVSEAILLINRQGKILLGNPGAERIFGYERKELQGLDIEKLIPNRFRHNHKLYQEEFMRDPSNRQIGIGRVIYAQTRDGNEIPVEIGLSTYVENDEVFAIAFATDITKRKEQEAKIAEQYDKLQEYNTLLEETVQRRTSELRNALQSVRDVNENLLLEIEERRSVEAKLRKSQMLYNTIARNFPEGIIGVLDTEFRYVFVDGRELGKFGLDKDYRIGERIFASDQPELTSMAEEKLGESFRGNSVTFEVSLGETFYEVLGTPLPDSRNSISEILVVIRDITRHKMYEEDLLKSLEREKQLNVLKSRFVSSVSHEFRTPLSTILSSVFLIENYSGEDADVHRKNHCSRIKRSINNLTELLEDFLSMEKLAEGKIKVIYSEFYLREYLEEYVNEIRSIKKKDQSIRLAFSGKDTLVLLDKSILTNILSNLISNAIKYSCDDGVIDIEVTLSEDVLRLSVRDHGIGIPEKEQRHIFKRFFRANNAVNIQGTGLGLNLVKKYVRLLKGDITFRSVVNVGSSFDISIPVSRP